MIQRLEAVQRCIEEAQKLNRQLALSIQVRAAIGSPEWHLCEAIDDKLFEALKELGS